jgi:hypothetical protein
MQCWGGDYNTALQFAHENHLTAEGCNIYVAAGWYDGNTGTDDDGWLNHRNCTASSYCYTCSPSAPCGPVQNYTKYFVSEFGAINGGTPDTVAQMQAEIFARGPIMCAIAVTPALEAYRGGIFVDTTNSTAAEHAIAVEGWGVEGNQPYWVVRGESVLVSSSAPALLRSAPAHLSPPPSPPSPFPHARVRSMAL